MRHFNHSHHWKRRIFFFILLAPIVILGVGGIVMLLWNAILPAVIHVGTISYLQALGILVLSKILFSGFRHGYHGRHGYSPEKWHYLKERWEKMTDEEKAKYKEELRNCCHPNKP